MKTKIEIIDVNQNPKIRAYKKNYCPWCDNKRTECKCKKGCSDHCQEINVKKLQKYKEGRKW